MQLKSSSDISRFLPDEYKSLKIYSYDQVDSTNTVAKKFILEKEKLPFVVISESQSAGRGRLGRSFYSPASTGIYMSIVSGGFTELPAAMFLTPAAAVAVTDAILSLTGKEAGIKWVNDIFLDNKKICGILAESQKTDSGFAVIVGIGLNMTTKNFPDELEDIAGSLCTDVSHEQMAFEIIKNLLNIIKSPQDKSYMKRYKDRSIVLGKEIYYIKNNEKKTATAIDFDNSGGLIIQTPENETVTLSGGEITVRIK